MGFSAIERFYLDALGGQLSRRDIIRRALALGLTSGAIASLLAACGSDDNTEEGGASGTTATESQASESSPPPASEGTPSSMVYEDPGGEIPELVIAHYSQESGPTWGEAGRLAAQSFSQLGLSVRPQPLAVSTFLSEITVGRGITDLAIGHWGGDGYRLDPHHWIHETNHSSAVRNATLYSNPEYDEIADAQAEELDVDRRRELVKEAQQIHHRDRPTWPICSTDSTYVFNSRRFPDLNPIPPQGLSGSGIQHFLDVTPADPDHQTLVIAKAGNETTTWNIFGPGENQVPSRAEHRLVYDTFARFSYDGELVPWAAEAWEVVDDTTIEITLRQGMAFHDGVPVTVDDAVFSFNFWIEHQPPLWQVAIRNHASAEKVDEQKFRVTLKQPWAPFFGGDLTYVVVLPKHIWEKVPDEVGVENPWDWDVVAAGQVIGSGPFMFDTWRMNQELIVKANPNHWHAPKIEALHYVFYSSPDSLRAAFENEDVDASGALLGSTAQQQLADQHPDFLSWVREPSHGTLWLWGNNEKAPFNDPAFRHALHLATPKQQIVDIAYQGNTSVALEGPVPFVLTEWYDDTLPETPFDMEAARRVLEEAAYTLRNGRLHYPE